MIQCRVVACRVGSEWHFYLINDLAEVLESAVLTEVSYEWGDMGSSEKADQRVNSIPPGGHALIWIDDGSGAEMRMDLRVQVTCAGTEESLLFEFPKLYRRTNLDIVPEIGEHGWISEPTRL